MMLLDIDREAVEVEATIAPKERRRVVSWDQARIPTRVGRFRAPRPWSVSTALALCGMWIERMDNRISSAADNQSREKKGQRLPGRKRVSEEGKKRERETERVSQAHLEGTTSKWPWPSKTREEVHYRTLSDPVFGRSTNTRLARSGQDRGLGVLLVAGYLTVPGNRRTINEGNTRWARPAGSCDFYFSFFAFHTFDTI